MYSQFKSHKEARRYAIAWLLSAAFLFIAEYSYSIVLHVPVIDFDWHFIHIHYRGLYIYTYDPFYLCSIILPNGHTLARYFFDVSNMPLTIVSALVFIKVCSQWKIMLVRYPATFVIDWALTCCLYVGRDIDKYEAGETNIIFVSCCFALLQLILYKHRLRLRRLIASFLIHLQTFLFYIRR